MRYGIGVDVGGTFTDFVLLDEETGRVSTAKLPSTLHDPAAATNALLRRTLRAALRLVLATLLLAAGCATLADTPAQERAERRWESCRAAAPGAQLTRVDPDGRLRAEVSSAFDRARLLECLRAAGTGEPLPEPLITARPVGP